MPRIARKDLNTPYVHIMVQGVNKEYIFQYKWQIKMYLNEVLKADSDDFAIIAYCMMNNHAHFLFYIENYQTFGKFMHDVNQKYAKTYNNVNKRCGVVFRNRYHAEPIYDREYLINCIKYIHCNPVKANMVKSCEDYLFSSYLDYKNNTGVSQNAIKKFVFNSQEDFVEILDDISTVLFYDDDHINIDSYITSGLFKYENQRKVNLVEILSDRKEFLRLIDYLKERCNINYVDIRKFFGISKGVLNYLVKRKN